MNEFTERELILLINSAHERALRLLDISGAMAQKGYTGTAGKEPTKDEIDSVFDGHKEHLALVDKLQRLKEAQALEFQEWWDVVGSGIAPLPTEDQEEHARRIAYRAYCACLKHTNLPKT